MTLRKTFITFCEQCVEIHSEQLMSKFFFIEHFFNFFLTLKNDKIMAVRRKFCNAAALIII